LQTRIDVAADSSGDSNATAHRATATARHTPRPQAKRIQYRPELISGFLAQTGLTLESEPP